LACSDWDNFETSWDFRDQPLLRPGLKGATLEASWRNWEAQSTAAIRRMQELETENNRLFIDAYGLDGELEPEVPEEQITLARADARRDMAAFLSYAVGCMMGRYSPDHPGLILANAGDSLREFLEKVGKPLAELTFAPDEDGIIPVLDGEWFEDDIVTRTRDFLRATFGEAMLIENLRFIEESLGKELRTYFLNDFYKEHLQTYKNRPIYWQLSSGKQKAFQCLIYLHRYTPATLARIRTEYAIPLQGKLSARITRLEEEVTQTSSSAARKKLQTDLDKSKKQIVELLTFDEQLRSYADQAITLDLDDGVKSNYAKFGPLVAEAKKICGTKED
jgi:type II restriction/modification system DNA methylase subunit YeeA